MSREMPHQSRVWQGQGTGLPAAEVFSRPTGINLKMTIRVPLMCHTHLDLFTHVITQSFILQLKAWASLWAQFLEVIYHKSYFQPQYVTHSENVDYSKYFI